MLETFVIVLREGFEAFLIVAISLAYLKKTGRADLARAVHWGIAVSILISVAGGVLLERAANQSLYEGILALVPPRQRPFARAIALDLGATLRAWVGAQLIAMVVLAALTGIGLWLLDVPFWLAFAIFTGVVVLIPFFGTLFSTLLPALLVLLLLLLCQREPRQRHQQQGAKSTDRTHHDLLSRVECDVPDSETRRAAGS